MTELDQRRLAGLVSFAVTMALLVGTVLAYQNDYFASFGWRGGEYANTFIWLTFGSLVAGLLTRWAAPSPWKAIGTGMVVASTLGLALIVLVYVLFMVALSHL